MVNSVVNKTTTKKPDKTAASITTPYKYHLLNYITILWILNNNQEKAKYTWTHSYENLTIKDDW